MLHPLNYDGDKMAKKVDHRVCSVSRTLQILGDRWIFLILREAFFGIKYYDQFISNLGIATNVLSSRLKILTDHGIMEKKKDAHDARRVKYRLTEKGLDLYSITLAFMQWGDRWLSDDSGPPLTLFHKPCGQKLTPTMNCSYCGQEIKAHDVSFEQNIME